MDINNDPIDLNDTKPFDINNYTFEDRLAEQDEELEKKDADLDSSEVESSDGDDDSSDYSESPRGHKDDNDDKLLGDKVIPEYNPSDSPRNGMTAGKCPRKQVTPRKRKTKIGAKANREIRQQQASINILLPMRPFYRTVREVLDDETKVRNDSIEDDEEKVDYLLSDGSVKALREAANSYLVDLFARSNILRGRAIPRRHTVKKHHFKHALDDFQWLKEHMMRM